LKTARLWRFFSPSSCGAHFPRRQLGLGRARTAWHASALPGSEKHALSVGAPRGLGCDDVEEESLAITKIGEDWSTPK